MSNQWRGHSNLVWLKSLEDKNIISVKRGIYGEKKKQIRNKSVFNFLSHAGKWPYLAVLMIIGGLLIIASCLFLCICKSTICMHHTPPLDWWINNVVMVRFLLSGTYTLSRSFPLTFFSHFSLSLSQMNLTLKFPNWRKASVAAAHHVTAFFSPWQCCSCPSSFCPSDCHREWHFMHSWTALSKGLCIQLLTWKLAGTQKRIK